MSEKKKLTIGIPGFLNSDQMFGVTGNYMQFADRYGDVRILMPHEDLVPVDLLILPGGLDLSPSKYGKQPSYKTSNHDVFKEFFYEQKLKLYVDAETPIFGICLGMQMLNAYFGGTLTQHLLAHEQSSGRWAMAHKIRTVYDKPNTKIADLIDVNSHHHQAITKERDLAPNFNVIAVAASLEPEGTIVEAFMHETLPIAGVQFHPEEMVFDQLSDTMIKEIMK